MSSLFVGSTAAYAPNFQQRAVNPKTDSIYIDPITGEKTTWKPGLIFPEKEEKKSNTTKVVGTVAGLAATAILAYVFRGKLKGVATKVVDFVKNSKVGQWAKDGLDKVKPHLSTAKTKVVDLYNKGVKWVKNLFKKAPATPATPATPTMQQIKIIKTLIGDSI